MRIIFTVVLFLMFGQITSASEFASSGEGCSRSYLSSSDFVALDKTEQTKELKRLADGLEQGCDLALDGLNYLSTSIPDNETDVLRWYRLLVEVSEIQTRQVRVQKALIDQFLEKIQSLSETLEAEKKAGTDLQQNNAKLTSERDQAQAELNDLRVQLSTLEEEQRATNLRFVALTNREARLRNSMDSSTKELTEKKSEISDLTAKIIVLRQDIVAENGKVASLEIKLWKKDEEILNGMTEISLLEDVIVQKNIDLQNLAVEILTLKDSIAAQAGIASILNDRIETQAQELNVANATILAQDATIKINEADIERLEQQLSDLQIRFDDKIAKLKSKISNLETELDTAKKMINELLSDNKVLTFENENLTIKAETLTVDLRESTAKLAAAIIKISELETSLRGTQVALVEVRLALLASERDVAEGNVTILDLEAELAAAIARNLTLQGEYNELDKRFSSIHKDVIALQKYRSEFFEKLRIALEGFDGITVENDRVFLQSQVTFDSGSTEISDAGHAQIAMIAQVVKEFKTVIPSDLKWVLQVDGHTDIQKVLHGGQFRDNWQLSTERALAVVGILIDEGAPPEHLAAAGYGEFQPRKSGVTPADLAANRRIEIRLTN